MKNDINDYLSKELDVCQVGVDTIIAIYLWSCYLFLAILITLSKQTKSWNLVRVGQNS